MQFSKFNKFVWVCWFLGKNCSYLLPLAWKIDNPYYHNVLWWPTVSHSVPFVIISTTGLSVYKLKEDLAWPLFLLFVERKKNKQFQCCLKNFEVKVLCWSSLNIYERNLIVIRMMDKISVKILCLSLTPADFTSASFSHTEFLKSHEIFSPPMWKTPWVRMNTYYLKILVI